jgi:hypothetical protein
MNTSSKETAPVAPTEPVTSNAPARTSLRTRSGIKAGVFNRGGGVYG